MIKKRKTNDASYLRRFNESFRNYQFKSVFFRYFRIIFIAFCVVIFAFSLAYYGTAISSRKREHNTEALKNFEANTNSFDLAIQRVAVMHREIAHNKDLNIVMTRNRESLLEKTNLNCINLRRRLQYECSGNTVYDSIYIYCINSDYIVSDIVDAECEQFHDTDWLSLASNESTVTVTRDIESINRRVISIIKPIYIGNAVGGYICYNLRYNYFGKLFGNILQNPDRNELSVLSDNNVCVFSTDESLLHRNMSDLIQGNDSSLLRYKSPIEGFTLLYRIEEANIYTILKEMITSIVIVVPVTLLLCTLLAGIIALRMYDSIFSILKFFEVSTYAPVNTNEGELADIRRNVLSINSRNRSLEAEFAQKLIELKKAQTIALQTQINPHFLLNTLQMLCFTLIKEGHSDSVKIITLISDILRSNLNTHEYMVDLESEIALTKQYLQIEAIRNGNSFHVEWDIAEDTLDKKLLRFTLQPILENSILHGFVDSKKAEKTITISSRCDINEGVPSLVITVVDTGIGMDEKTLADLRDRLELNYMPETKEIGIMNVSMRLKLLFGKDAHMSVDSKYGDGTTVTFRLPIIR
ncbi:MAG: histidine kinase [Clostridiales bacterium]|nr:histidine kinase [Clostridiales bacterium]